MPLDIHSQGPYPANALSNFTSHPFMMDGVYIASMEGFLQALKFSARHKQLEVCRAVGIAAKKKGSSQNWQKDQFLYWDGITYQRQRHDYKELLYRAFREQMLQSASFKQALVDTGKELLTHSIGSDDPKQTVITRIEFCSILMKVRDEMHDIFDTI